MKPMYAEPIKVSLDGKDFKNVVDIGLDRAGLIEDPKEWNSVGWFTKSARVGEPGNLIVTGHYDDTLGQPAAFWQLKNVGVGDKVLVAGKLGNILSYSVTDSFYLDIDDPRRLEVLKNDSSVSEMTLITCSGKWIASEGTYDKRLVVKAQLN